MNSFFHIKQLVQHLLSQKSSIYNLTGSSAALLLALEDAPFAAVEKDEARAEILKRDMDFYREIFSGGKYFSADRNGPASSGRRAEVLSHLTSGDSLVTSENNLIATLWDRKHLAANSLTIKKGDSADRSTLEGLLQLLGYRQADIVVEKGQYSRRGWIIDIYPSTSEDPYRLEFFGDEIEQLRIFDVETQRSKEDAEGLFLLPATEPEEALPLTSVVEGKKFFCLCPAEDKEGLPENALFLSRYSFEIGQDSGEEAGAKRTEAGWLDAGMLSMKGLGILPEERKTLDDIPERIGKWQGQQGDNRGLFERPGRKAEGPLQGKDIIVPSVERRI
jgi:hypothetical protein